MAKIVLSVEEIQLGYLTEEGGKYLFCANAKGILKAKYEYPIEMLLFKLNESGVGIYNEIPYPFSTFLPGTHREDIMLKSRINQSDSDFVRIYKLAGLSLAPKTFQIHRAN